MKKCQHVCDCAVADQEVLARGGELTDTNGLGSGEKKIEF